MNFKVLESSQKLRGGYYTPPNIAEFLCRWALTPTTKSILEPSCGDGRFLEALQLILSEEKMIGNGRISVDAVELLSDQAELAQAKACDLNNALLNAKVYCADFFSWINNIPLNKTWDAIVGNPPYIRYQYFDKEQQERAKELFVKANIPFSKLTNAWVYFVVGSLIHLSPGGRIAMVIPSEISYIIHAHPLRKLIEQELDYIRLLHFQNIVFEGTLQGTVLLLGEKRRDRDFLGLDSARPDDHPTLFVSSKAPKTDFDIYDVKDDKEMLRLKLNPEPDRSISSLNGNWMLALLGDKERVLMEKLSQYKRVKSFDEIANVTIGIVTGANKFFCVNEQTLDKYGLHRVAHPMLARAELIKGIKYTKKDQEENSMQGKSVHFLEFPRLPETKLPKKAKEYILSGEESQLNTRYKCRIREPWYWVPYVWVSEVALLKRCHLYPRLVLNELGAYSTDTAYRIRMRQDFTGRAQDLVFSFLNSFTLLLAELMGRHYAGGVLELVPSEIRQLMLPLAKPSRGTFNQLDRLIREKAELTKILDFTDSIVLSDNLGLSRKQIVTLRKCYHRVRNRRLRKG